MVKVGITGGIGSGKSYICHLIKAIGFPIYECDSEAKRLMVENQHIIRSLTELIDTTAYDAAGILNKSAVAQFLFQSPDNAKKVNDIVHPVVKEDFQKWAETQNSHIVFMESAILFESGFNSIVDYSIAVCAPTEVRLQRAMQRDSASREQIEARMRHQMSDEECRTLADFHIDNDGTANVEEQIAALIKRIS